MGHIPLHRPRRCCRGEAFTRYSFIGCDERRSPRRRNLGWQPADESEQSMTSLLPVSVLVQTKNEAVGIGACLASLKQFDEVIVVDSASTDGTADVAAGMGVEVINFVWNGHYPKKKQWQLDNVATRNEWILFLDADETPSQLLVAELEKLFSAGPGSRTAAVDIDLDYVFAGRMLKHGHRVTKRALVRRDRVAFVPVDDLAVPGMGELEGHYQPVVEGSTVRAKGRILHNDLDPVSSWFQRHNRYSDWEAHLRFNATLSTSVRRNRTLKGRVFDAMPAKPLVFFLYGYVVRAGFLDGRAGFDYAFALAAYYWQIGLKYRELLRANRSMAGVR